MYISLFGCCNLCNSLKCYVVLNAIKVSAWNLKCSLCADYKIYENAGNL